METSDPSNNKINSSCENTSDDNPSLALKDHWDNAYLKSPENRLGWFEQEFSPSLRLLDQCKLETKDPCLLVGSGNSQFPDKLLERGLEELWVTDISEVAIQEVKARLGEKINYRVGDILQAKTLEGVPPIQLWFDRAVLHFFTEKKDQETYFNFLRNEVKQGGYVIFAEFNLSGSEKCSGLPVFRYDEKRYQERLGNEFKLLDGFDHTYIMPSGNARPYSYALFQRLGS
jgi:EEF1A lysine methyltransferase 2